MLNELSQSKKLKKITMSASAAVMVIGLAATFSFEANAFQSTGTGKGNWKETNCICVATGEIVGNSNDCDPGTATCNDNNCSHTTC